MSDPLHTDLNVARTFPKEYSRLLFPVCGAHALWAPRLSQDGGGALGDVGMIVNGRFWKDFNVFEHDEEQNTSPLTLPAHSVNRDQSYDTSIMSSSRDSTIEFHMTGSTEIVGLPLQTLDVQPEVSFARAQDGLAFLAPLIPTRWDGIRPSLHIELGAWLAAQCQARPELEDRVVVTEVVRSSGYVGGLILSRSTEASANLSLGSAITASAGGSIGHRRSLNAVLRGPNTGWTPNMPADYTIILKYTTAVTRPGFLRRVGIKLGLSRPTSSSQSRATSPGATNGASTGSQESTGTAPSPNVPVRAGRQYDAASPPLECDSDEIYDPSPLTPFLDMALRQHEDIDIAVGDLSVLSEFIARNSTYPVPDPSFLDLTIGVHDVQENYGKAIARLLSLDPVQRAPVPRISHAHGVDYPATSLCCRSVLPHRGIRTQWESLVSAFLNWLADAPKDRVPIAAPSRCEIIIRLTTTMHVGRSCGCMVYAASRMGEVNYTFMHVTTNYSQQMGFTDQCASKSYSCMPHGLYFRLDLYRSSMSIRRGADPHHVIVSSVPVANGEDSEYSPDRSLPAATVTVPPSE